ncbi:hypothetical protein Tco_0186361 [Tanacetum coccineum]
MHGVNNPELTKHLNEQVPKTMEEMMTVTTAFIRGEAAAASKKKGHLPWKSQDQPKRHASEQKSDFRGQSREGRGSSRWEGKGRVVKGVVKFLLHFSMKTERRLLPRVVDINEAGVDVSHVNGDSVCSDSSTRLSMNRGNVGGECRGGNVSGACTSLHTASAKPSPDISVGQSSAIGKRKLVSQSTVAFVMESGLVNGVSRDQPEPEGGRNFQDHVTVSTSFVYTPTRAFNQNTRTSSKRMLEHLHH